MKSMENDFTSNYDVQKWLLLQKKLSVIETLVSATSFVLLAFVVPIVLGPSYIIAMRISGMIDRIFARDWRFAKLFIKQLLLLLLIAGGFFYAALYQLESGNRWMFAIIWLAGGAVLTIVMFGYIGPKIRQYLESLETHVQPLGGI